MFGYSSDQVTWRLFTRYRGGNLVDILRTRHQDFSIRSKNFHSDWSCLCVPSRPKVSERRIRLPGRSEVVLTATTLCRMYSVSVTRAQHVFGAATVNMSAMRDRLVVWITENTVEGDSLDCDALGCVTPCSPEAGYRRIGKLHATIFRLEYWSYRVQAFLKI